MFIGRPREVLSCKTLAGTPRSPFAAAVPVQGVCRPVPSLSGGMGQRPLQAPRRLERKPPLTPQMGFFAAGKGRSLWGKPGENWGKP